MHRWQRVSNLDYVCVLTVDCCHCHSIIQSNTLTIPGLWPRRRATQSTSIQSNNPSGRQTGSFATRQPQRQRSTEMLYRQLVQFFAGFCLNYVLRKFFRLLIAWTWNMCFSSRSAMRNIWKICIPQSHSQNGSNYWTSLVLRDVWAMSLIWMLLMNGSMFGSAELKSVWLKDDH